MLFPFWDCAAFSATRNSQTNQVSWSPGWMCFPAHNINLRRHRNRGCQGGGNKPADAQLLLPEMASESQIAIVMEDKKKKKKSSQAV
jgi:hypothetical protein